MRFAKSFVSKTGVFGELLLFLWQKKPWWLVPTIVILVLLSLLLVLGNSTVTSFIYKDF